MTTLLDACKNDDLPLIKKLIKNGTDVNIQDSDGWTPLHYAVNKCNFLIIPLIHEGANIDARDNEKNTCLHFASFYGGIRSIEILLKYGANPLLLNSMLKKPSEVSKYELINKILKASEKEWYIKLSINLIEMLKTKYILSFIVYLEIIKNFTENNLTLEEIWKFL